MKYILLFLKCLIKFLILNWTVSPGLFKMSELDNLIEKMKENGLITIVPANMSKQVLEFINIMMTTYIEENKFLPIRYKVFNLRN